MEGPLMKGWPQINRQIEGKWIEGPAIKGLAVTAWLIQLLLDTCSYGDDNLLNLNPLI